MIRKLILPVLMLLFLTACASAALKIDVPENVEAKSAQAVIEKYIQAYQEYDADLLISLFHDEYIFMDYGLDDGPFTLGNVQFAINESMAEPDTWNVKFASYTVTPGAQFAVLDGAFSMQSKLSGKMITAPAHVVIEFVESKIIAETWYYNGDVFH